MRERHSYPTGPFPYLIAPDVPRCNQPKRAPPSVLNRSQQRVLKLLADGARLLLDVLERRALVYTFRRGPQELAELSVRSLANLVRLGWLVVTGREGRMVHYGLASGLGASPLLPASAE